MKPAASLALVLLAGCQAAPRPDHADRDPHVVEFVERQSVLARRQQRDGDFAAAIATWEAVRLVAPDDDRVGRLHQLQTLRRLRIAGLEAQLRATSSAARRRAICLDILALEGGHQGAIDILRAQELRDALHNAAPVPDKPPYRPATAHSGTHAQKHAEQPVMPPRSAPTPDDASLLVAIDRALHKEDLTTAYALFARGAHALAVNGRTVLDRLGTALHAHGRSLLRVDLDQGIVWLRRAIEVLPDNARAESDLRAALRMQKNLKRIRRG
ncbi:MAG: hypothetical protein H6993_04880 [Pseudomonadales bacterium]|nr:hypothetical protein [Pseudomonadales bacterium]MCP5183273.1 hypothetical protein [Pseudomonadales bacterium]